MTGQMTEKLFIIVLQLKQDDKAKKNPRLSEPGMNYTGLCLSSAGTVVMVIALVLCGAGSAVCTYGFTAAGK